MKLKKMKYSILSLLLFAFLTSMLSGCEKENKNLTTNGFAFNTTYSITLYQGGTQKILDACTAKCASYEKVFSRTLEESELYQINEIEKIYEKVRKEGKGISNIENKKTFSFTKEQCDLLKEQIEKSKSKQNMIAYQISQDGSITFSISSLLSRMIEKGLAYSKKSNGRFDIAIEPVSALWDFTADSPKPPKKEDLANALAYVDYQNIVLQGQKLTFLKPGMGIDLGGIAKGFIADELKVFLVKKGVTSGLINLGGNVLCIGKKENKQAFHIGIQQPFADRNETIAAVSVEDMSIVSSGIYERYFKTKSGTMYHHILNPKTGYSYDNDLMAVTILSKKSVDGDGLSTSCFAMGKEDGLLFVNSLDDVEAVFITKDEKLHYSKGFKKLYLVESK